MYVKNKILTLLTCLAFFSSVFSQGYFPKEKNGKWGFVNTSQEWVIKPKFIAVNKFSEGLAAVQKGIKWGFVNMNGDFVVKPVYGYVNDFKEGKAGVLSFKPLEGASNEDKWKHKWGFVNKVGDLIIPFRFRNIFSFENDIALVANWDQYDKELYMINEHGVAVSSPFVSKQSYSDELLKIKNIRINGDSTYKYITKFGENVTKWYINNFEFDNFPVKVYLPSDLRNDTVPTTAFKGDSKEKLCAMMNKESEVFTRWFNQIGDFTQGYAPAQFNYEWGIVNEQYEWVVTPKYTGIYLLDTGFYSAQVDLTKSVLLNEKGDVLSEAVENIEVFDTHFHIMSYTDKLGKRTITYKALFDKKGKQRTQWHKTINQFHNGITRVEEVKICRFPKDSIGLHNWYNYAVDSTGEILCFWRAENKISWDKSYRIYKDSILNFLFAPKVSYYLSPEYFETVFTKDFKLNIRQGELLFQGGNFKEGMALVSKKVGKIKKKIHGLEFTIDDIRYGYINWIGKLVIPYKFKEAASFSDGKAIIAENNKYGAIDYTGRVIIKPQYQLMGDFGNNLAPVFKDSTWGYVNSKNALVVKYQFDEVRPFKYGYAAVRKGKEWGVIDVDGSIVLKFNYRKAPKAIATKKVEVLKKGVGYVIINLE